MSNFEILSKDGVDRLARGAQRTGGLVFFHHIPKTAGTSLVKELRTCLPPYRNIFAPHYTDGPPREDALMEAAEAFLKDLPEIQYRSASGHLRLQHVRRISEAVPHMRMFTFIRDPLERVVSEYRYTRTEKHPTHAEMKDRYPDIEAFVDDPINQNRMWNFIAPRDMAPDEKGLRKVFRRYLFIGTLEAFDRDFSFLMGLFGYPKLPAAQSNKARASKDNEVEMTDALRDHILACNSDDVALYNAVTETLEKRTEEMEAFVEERLALFNEGRA